MSAGDLTKGHRPSKIHERLPTYDHRQGNVFDWILNAVAQVRQSEVQPPALPNPLLKEYRRFK